MTKNSHIIVSEDKKAAVWVGVIDDLWKLGKPVGVGGPWTDSNVVKDVASDPYLIGFYDKRTLALSHHSREKVSFLMEVSVTDNGKWLAYETIEVEPSAASHFKFPDSFDARWIRFTANKDCNATILLEYK